MSAQSLRSEEAVEALAMYLMYRDWPTLENQRTSPQRRYEYRCMAAAILGGEAWAIRKAWPEGAYDIQTRSEFPEPELTTRERVTAAAAATNAGAGAATARAAAAMRRFGEAWVANQKVRNP